MCACVWDTKSSIHVHLPSRASCKGLPAASKTACCSLGGHRAHSTQSLHLLHNTTASASVDEILSSAFQVFISYQLLWDPCKITLAIVKRLNILWQIRLDKQAQETQRRQSQHRFMWFWLLLRLHDDPRNNLFFLGTVNLPSPNWLFFQFLPFISIFLLSPG